MEERKQSLNNNNEIGNIIIDYSGNNESVNATAIKLADGKPYILAYISVLGRQPRLIIQDLNGKTVKKLTDFDGHSNVLYYGHGEFTVDNDNIYIFTSGTARPMFYIIDKNSLIIKNWKPLGPSCIQSVCCNDNGIATFDMNKGEIQFRDKKGNITSTTSVRGKRGIQHTFVYPTSEGFQHVGIFDLEIDKKYIKECEDKFGREIMRMNEDPYISGFAYDDSTQTSFIAKRNIIYVINKSGIQGIMYFKDKSIIGLTISPDTNSLIISSDNWPESQKNRDYNLGGSVEVLPLSMVPERIKSSKNFLMRRNLSKYLYGIVDEIIDIVDGDIDKVFSLLQGLKNNVIKQQQEIEDKDSSGLEGNKVYIKKGKINRS